MVGRFELGCRRNARSMLALSQAVLVAGLLSACSSVPDAVNPVEWYKGASDLVTGRERPEVASPVPPKGEFPDVNRIPDKTADQRKDLAEGLVADRGNANYAEPVRREVTPTRPLARRTPAPAETQVAKAPQPAVPPKPVVQTAELPAPPAQQDSTPSNSTEPSRLSPDRPAPTARGDLTPDAPVLAMQPPPRPDIPETVPMPGKGRPKPLQAQYERRLAESAQQVVRPGIVEVPQRSPALAGAGGDAPIHLIAPGSAKKRRSGGGKGMAAPLPAPSPAASFQVASVDFSSGAKLTAADRAAIADVARLYRQTGGIVRVLGHAPAQSFSSNDAVAQVMGGLDASIRHANAVARELSRRGVPSAKILVGADPAAAASAGAQVYIDVM